MAYMNQAKKQTIAVKVKPILAKYGVKGTLSVRNGSTIVLKLTSGSVDFIRDMKPVMHGKVVDKVTLMQHYNFAVNEYWLTEHYEGDALAFLSEIIPAMKAADWYDRSDIQSDYFDVAYYYNIYVGAWKKPYTLTN